MIRQITLPALAALSLVACKASRTDVDYDTADPYGIPDYSNAGTGAETADYQAVNPPADSTYGPAAYEDTSTPTAAPATPARPAARTTGSRTHTIAKGDTLWGLSKKYGVTADAIKSANNMTGDTVVLGKTIKIPAK